MAVINLNRLDHISVYIYIVLEFLSLTLAATAGEKIGIDFFKYLSETEKPDEAIGTFSTVILSIIFIILAGLIETYYLYEF